MNSDPRSIAKVTRLRYVSERTAGILRVPRGKGFSYQLPAAVAIDDHRERIHSLVIPPAWRDVWICVDPRGHLQATGRDARGRLQYRYHPDWTSTCEIQKFRRTAELGRDLPRIRRRVSRDLAQPGLPRTKVLAAIVRLLERSLIRVGNDEYARTNGSFGLTTLRKHHVKLAGDGVRFCFVGKSSIEHEIDLFASAVAAVIRACQRLPGRDLFQYQNDQGNVRDVTSLDLNAYLAEIATAPVTAKDFRTWGATVLMHRALLQNPLSPSLTPSRREQNLSLRKALTEVASALGNTVTVCRKSYVHPALPRLYLEGRLAPVTWREPPLGRRNLSALERATLRLIESQA